MYTWTGNTLYADGVEIGNLITGRAKLGKARWSWCITGLDGSITNATNRRIWYESREQAMAGAEEYVTMCPHVLIAPPTPAEIDAVKADIAAALAGTGLDVVESGADYLVVSALSGNHRYLLSLSDTP